MFQITAENFTFSLGTVPSCGCDTITVTEYSNTSQIPQSSNEHVSPS